MAIKIISLSGYIGAGKNQFCTILMQHLHDRLVPEAGRWAQKAHATKLKEICALLLNVPVSKFEDAEFKKSNLGPEWDRDLKSARDFIYLKKGQAPYVEYPDEIRKVANELGFKWTRTVREMLQEIGTDCLRYGFHPDVWVNALWCDYTTVPVGETHWHGHRITQDPHPTQQYPNWIITDTRFANEIDAVRQRSGVCVRINRGPRTSDHASEVTIDTVKDWDYQIDNTGSMEQLHEKAKEFIKHFNL